MSRAGVIGTAGVEPPPQPADRKLKIVREVKPTYTPEAREAKLAGVAKMEILVDENGRVSSAQVLEGPDVFHQAAIDAVRQWEFKPPGRTVKTTVEMVFSLRW